MAKFPSVHEAAAWRLCVGCGACACACPERRIRLVDVEDDGIRPILSRNDCTSCGECLKVCPGLETSRDTVNEQPNAIPELLGGFGPSLELWEGYATDEEIRFHGSSGGLASALALYCLEKEGMHGALHTGPDLEKPWKNKTVLSKSRSDFLARTGSRYSPASPCDGLSHIESLPGPCVFIGKPCDVAGTRMSQAARPELDRNVGLAIAFFCAGTPSTLGLLELLKSMEVDPASIHEIRFRGKGWPGKFTAKLRGEQSPEKRMSYMESWGFLQKYRPFRCYLCPDGTGEFADISCGDPWYREIPEDDPGHSLVLVRTEKGRKILHSAKGAGYVYLKRVDSKALVNSQKNLLEKRRAIWGRLAAMKLSGLPTPKLVGFSLFDNWRKLPLKEKLRSIFGTARRIVTRRYYRKQSILPHPSFPEKAISGFCEPGH